MCVDNRKIVKAFTKLGKPILETRSDVEAVDSETRGRFGIAFAPEWNPMIRFGCFQTRENVTNATVQFAENIRRLITTVVRLLETKRFNIK
jgi:hypothetical protein